MIGCGEIGMADTENAELSVPKGYEGVVDAFKQLQNAFKARDVNLICDMVATSEYTPSREEHIARFKKMDQRRWDTDIFKIKSDGEIIRVEPLETVICRVWLKWEEGRRIGCVYFGKQGDQWKWLGVAEDRPLTFKTYPFYDYQTPVKSYESLKQAVNIEDTLGIYTILCSELKSKITFDDYDTLVKKRKKEKNSKYSSPNLPDVEGRDPDFFNANRDLEVEILEPEAGTQKCKVWLLDKDKKRVGFELFVKEIVLGGEEWKWVPDSKCIWYPKKN
jgi:hypothetical protein